MKSKIEKAKKRNQHSYESATDINEV